MVKTVLVLATLDTKGEECLYLKEQTEKDGVKALIVDLSCKELKSKFSPWISCLEVAEAAGKNLMKFQLWIEGQHPR